MKRSNRQIEDRVSELQRILQEKEEQIRELEAHTSAQASEISRLTKELKKSIENIHSISKSSSWKVTAPFRFVFDWIILYPKYVFGRMLTCKPGQFSSKSKFETSTNKPQKSELLKPHAINLVYEETRERAYVSRSGHKPLENKSARLIAFYLPQFHPIPENDKWWGKGFTEWNSVKKAKPLFEHHHQPRIPADLGYYDLRDLDVQRKQVELAKQYGLEGFCFYFYWFHGERLLETPVLNYLANRDLDLPFCLCWANENWTRTWDGKDGEVLMGQEHSEADDLAFIEYLSKFLKDSRYIHVGGKPLLLVYRPGLLPDCAKTAVRWRQWCRDNGVGEIYLAYTQSFDKFDPADIGFDAAIEFPPNDTWPEVITDQMNDLPFSFKGVVYDWTSIASRSEAYLRSEYPLFRGVNTSWDNTARRKYTGAVFAGSTPSRYQRWLENAIADTQKRFDDHSEQLVFINAWNEWAEGAYLEPDDAYGYAYLQATRNALEKKPR